MSWIYIRSGKLRVTGGNRGVDGVRGVVDELRRIRTEPDKWKGGRAPLHNRLGLATLKLKGEIQGASTSKPEASQGAASKCGIPTA